MAAGSNLLIRSKGEVRVLSLLLPLTECGRTAPLRWTTCRWRFSNSNNEKEAVLSSDEDPPLFATTMKAYFATNVDRMVAFLCIDFDIYRFPSLPCILFAHPSLSFSMFIRQSCLDPLCTSFYSDTL